MSKRIGPSMSTEPGWTAGRCPYSSLLGSCARPGPTNDPSMLLSFERPAPAGAREGRRLKAFPTHARIGRRTRLSTVLENCTEATSAAIDKRRLKNGYHRALMVRAFRKECQTRMGQITVKIVRAHGGCLGTKSR